MDRCLRIGLSGGIGSGKSEVSTRFQALGIPVIDADEISRELVAPGQPALDEIVQTFGPGLLNLHAGLDRRAMRNLVFSNPQALRRLEMILHPRVRSSLEQQANSLPGAYCILSIPLLLESGFTDLVDRVLIVDCSPAQQRRRASERDKVDNVQIQSILDRQASRADRLQAADDVIHNDADLHHLDKQVRDLHQQYLHLSRPLHSPS